MNDTWGHAAARTFVRSLVGIWVRPKYITLLRLVTDVLACLLLGIGGGRAELTRAGGRVGLPARRCTVSAAAVRVGALARPNSCGGSGGYQRHNGDLPREVSALVMRSAIRHPSPSGLPCRRQMHRMRADAETAFSLRYTHHQLDGAITSHLKMLVPPAHATCGETPNPQGKTKRVPQRQHQQVQ
jgi:hypothetical protein